MEKLADVYSKLGMDYSERVLPSICNEVLKAVAPKAVGEDDLRHIITASMSNW